MRVGRVREQSNQRSRFAALAAMEIASRGVGGQGFWWRLGPKGREVDEGIGAPGVIRATVVESVQKVGARESPGLLWRA